MEEKDTVLSRKKKTMTVIEDAINCDRPGTLFDCRGR